MTTLTDLREIFEADAGLAPGPDGVTEAAQRGATRIRRRRRLAAATGAAVLVAAVTVVAPLVADRRQADGPPPASTPAGRPAGQVTLAVDPAAGYVVTSQQLHHSGQHLNFRPLMHRPDEKLYVTGALAIDPGVTFDPALLHAGARVTVSGHEAWYVADYPLAAYLPGPGSLTLRRQPEPSPVVGWRDPGGAWVLVHQDNHVPRDRAKLLAAAAAVRITPPRDLPLPVGLGRLPSGQPLNYATTDRRTFARWSLGGSVAPPDALFVVGETPGTGVTIEARRNSRQAMSTSATRVADVAGHEAWYSAATNGTARGNGTLGVRAGACMVTFSAWDSEQVTPENLREIAEAATYAADCGNPATWVPAVRR